MHGGVTGSSWAERDAIVVGAGPNGLAAAITIAREGRSVLVLEAAETIGGGSRTAELTRPGFRHDICSAIHPMVPASPFLSNLPLERHGLELVHSPAPLAHPLEGGRAALLERSIAETATGLGAPDGDAYSALMEPLVADVERLLPQLLAPLSVPRHPLALARFGLEGLRSGSAVARARFEGEPARGLFAGLAAHSILPLEAPATAAFGLVLGITAHAVGWPFPRGGSQRIVDAMAAHLRELGGEIECGRRVSSLDELPPARAVLCDVSPRGLLEIGGTRLPDRYRRGLERYRHGPGAFKLDYALDGPIPWSAEECGRAATVHLGSTLGEIAASERAVDRGEPPERPYVLLAQQSLFDDTRAPPGKHTAWAYCHVPNGSDLRHDRAYRGPDRALRSRLPRPRAGACGDNARGAGGLQRQLHRWRHQRRPPGPAPAFHAASRAGGPLPYAGRGALSLLGFDAAGGRGARDVRVARGQGRARPGAALSRARRVAWTA